MNMDNNKMPLLLSKIHDFHERILENMVGYLNFYVEKNNLKLKFLTNKEITKVSRDTKQKIMKLI